GSPMTHMLKGWNPWNRERQCTRLLPEGEDHDRSADTAAEQAPMEVSEAIRTMRSVREFAKEALPDDAIEAILNAGRRAQSSKNSQPWTFVVIRRRETLQRLAQCGEYAGHLAGAALAVALISSSSWDFDLGQATAFMQLRAW